MDNNSSHKATPKNSKKSDYAIVRLDKTISKKVKKIVDMANKKSTGKKIISKNIVELIIENVDENLIKKVVEIARQNSLTLKDKNEAFLKESLSKFNGSMEELQEDIMRVYRSHLSQNLS